MSKLPDRKFIGDRHYRLYVGLVATYHADGTPRLVSVIKPEQTVDLAGGEHFVTCYLPELDWNAVKPERESESKLSGLAPESVQDRAPPSRDGVEALGIIRGLRIVRDTGLSDQWPAAARAAFEHSLHLAELCERLIG